MWLIMCDSHLCPQVTCRPKMGRLLPLLQCPRQHWDDSGRSKVRMTLWAWIGTKNNLHAEPNNKINLLESSQTVGNHVCPATAGRLSASNVRGKLQRPQLVYLWAHPSAPVPGDVLQHDLLSQHDGALRPGHRGYSHGGENLQWVCMLLTAVSACIVFVLCRFVFFFFFLSNVVQQLALLAITAKGVSMWSSHRFVQFVWSLDGRTRLKVCSVKRCLCFSPGWQ